MNDAWLARYLKGFPVLSGSGRFLCVRSVSGGSVFPGTDTVSVRLHSVIRSVSSCALSIHDGYNEYGCQDNQRGHDRDGGRGTGRQVLAIAPAGVVCLVFLRHGIGRVFAIQVYPSSILRDFKLLFHSLVSKGVPRKVHLWRPSYGRKSFVGEGIGLDAVVDLARVLYRGQVHAVPRGTPSGPIV